MKCFFLDWTEPPVAPWLDSAVRTFTVTFDGFPRKFKKSTTGLAEVWFRSDGFFIFSLQFTEASQKIVERRAHNEPSPFDIFALEVAGHASDLIKQAIFKNADYPEYNPGIRQSHPDISVKPIKLSKDLNNLNPDFLKRNLKSDRFLRDIAAKIKENTSGFYTPKDVVPAVLLLRRQYGRCHDKALAVRKQYEDAQFHVPYWFKLRARLKWPLEAQKFLIFRSYSYGHVTFLWVIFSLVILGSGSIGNETLETPVVLQDTLDGADGLLSILMRALLLIPEFVYLYVAYGTMPVLVTVWLLVIREKRRKTISAYDKAIGILKSGNYLHAILVRVLTNGIARGTTAAGSVPVNFDLLIARLLERRRIEVEKLRTDKRILTWLIIILSLVLGSLYNVPVFLLSLLNLEQIKEWIDLINFAPTRRN